MATRRKDTSCEDTYRAGTKNNNRMTHVRTPEMVSAGECNQADIDTFEQDGRVHVRGLSGGVSLFNRVGSSRPWWYRVPAQKLPVGLVWQWRGPEQGLPEPGTHYQIEPLVSMPLDHYRRLLAEVQVEPKPIPGS